MSNSGDVPANLADWQDCQASEDLAEPAVAQVKFEDMVLEQLSKRAFDTKDQSIECTDGASEASRELRTTLTGGEDSELFGAELCVSFWAEGHQVISGSDMGIIKIWDDAHPAEAKILKGHYNGWVNAITVAASPDKKRLISGGEDARIKVWNLESLEVLIVSDLDRPIHSVCFRPDAKGVAFGLADGTICLWNWSTRDEAKKLRMLKEHSKWVYSLEFSPDGQQLVSGSGDGSIRIWDLNGGTGAVGVRSIDVSATKVYSLSLSADGKQLAFGLSDGNAGVWDLENNKIKGLQPDPNGIWAVAYSPVDDMVALGLSGGNIGLWDWKSNKTRALCGHSSTVWSVAFSPDGKRLLSGSADESIRLWNVPGVED